MTSDGGTGEEAVPSEAALVRSAWVPVRADPSHRSEMVTQWVAGEPLAVLGGEEGWLRTEGPDGYRGWTPVGGLLALAGEEVERWAARATGWSIGTPLRPAGGERGAGEESARAVLPSHLPWGARVPIRTGPDGVYVELPGGRRGVPALPERLVEEEARARRFPRAPGAVLSTARGWLGVPYLWGGRTRGGADCSGFLQAVFALHGVALPRDSVQQMRAGPPVEGAVEGRDRRRSGDLLFFGEDRERVTHVALQSEGSRIVHAAEDNGAVADDDLAGPGPLAERLRSRLLAVTRPLTAGA